MRAYRCATLAVVIAGVGSIFPFALSISNALRSFQFHRQIGLMCFVDIG